jgi:serine/threonine protein kinase
MAEQPQRHTPPDGDDVPPSAPPSSDAAVPHTDDTPTIISKVTPRPAAQGSLFNGILRGRKLAHFELIEPIGVGGMAAVLRARDTQLDRLVALKILPPEMASDPENVARFHQEARAAARLDHETIARVFFCGEDQSLHFIAFEYVEGENLRALIDRRGPLPVQEALHYMLQVATGLAHAASRGVVHRDIKPSNIIVSPNGRAKLVDMGLARNLGPHTDNGLTQSGVTLGTFDYISPEQALEPRDADVRSDIYSLGCTFYHVLTGQPPVPEGTAARKLHHHQHVPPIDPRQLNPDIPDEVAAILSRMMAKDPRQRYQRPEDLVQHLLQATHRLGTGQEAPDGVLFVDAALPAPPRTRPLLVAGCAAAIVVILVLVIGPSQEFRIPGFSSPPPDAKVPESPDQEVAGGPVAPAKGAGGGSRQPGSDPVPPENAKPIPVAVASAEDLVRLARDMAAEKSPDKSYEIIVTGDLRLGGAELADEGTGIVLRGKSITLRAEEGTTRPNVWTRYVAAGNAGGLIIEAENVQLRGLRFVADANTNAPAPGQVAAGVVVRGAVREVSARRCEFLQGNWQPDSLFGSLAVQGTAARTHVDLTSCCFLGGKEVRRPDSQALGGAWLVKVNEGGRTAVAVAGGAQIDATDCAFGPHASLFRFEQKSSGSKVSLSRCTALTGDEWALAYFSEETSAAVTANSCLFGRVDSSPDGAGGMMMPSERKPATSLVRYAKDPKQVAYQGTSNRYLNLDAVRLKVNDDATMPADSFAAQLAALPGADEKVLMPDARPWQGDPIALLQGSLKPDELLAAFRLDFARVPDLLRYGKDSSVALVGMEQAPWGAEWKADQLPSAGGTPAVVAKVVDPTQKTDAAKGVYRSLAAAVEDAKAGDVIVLRHTGELPVSPVKLVKNGLTLTIKPDGDSRPVLVLDQDAPESQAALFRVHSGQLNLEGLEFRLRPTKAGFKSQAVALLFGDGGVQFTRCSVTLDGRQATAPLAAVTLADSDEAMMQPGGSGLPRAAFDTCFVRGDGDLISARASRPFDADVKDSLLALTGSLLNVDAGTRDAPAPSGKDIAVQLTQTTAYLGGHLVRLRAANMGSLVPVHCLPKKSLIVAAGDKKALLHLEGAPKDLATATQRLQLNGDGNNYANFAPMLDQQPGGDEMPTPTVTKEEWKQLDDQSKFEDVKFAGPLWAEGDVAPAEVLPRAFVLKTTLKGIGARLPKLPLPGES